MASQLIAGDASPALPTAELEAARAALDAADQAFLQALVARDRDAIERHLASDVMFLDDEDARHGKLAFLMLMEPVFDARHGFTFEGETVAVKVARSGELGYTIDATTITVQPPHQDEPTVTSNHTLTVWTRTAPVGPPSGDVGQPWKIRVYSTLIVHPELGHATEPRTALMRAWPELADRIAAGIRLEWTPESTTRAASGEMAYSFGAYSVKFTQDDETEDGTGSYVAVWEKGEKGHWQLAAEAYTPPLIR
jgi:ketosteroid isomerase-like protein